MPAHNRRRQSGQLRSLAAGTAAVVLGVAVIWFLFVPAAGWLARHDAGSAHGATLVTALKNARSAYLTLAAGILAAGALVFTARNYGLSRESQVTDRYTKAIEQLGSDKIAVRIGGIYALERIALDSARDHPTVVEVLAAFLREHPDPAPADNASPPGMCQDVRAAITVIARRDDSRTPRDRVGGSILKVPASYARTSWE